MFFNIMLQKNLINNLYFFEIIINKNKKQLENEKVK